MDGYDRYAVYVAPDADSPLGRFGNAWLGFEPRSGVDLPRPALVGLTESDIRRATVAPARYGFHATLKPPFALAEGADVAALDRAVAGLAAALAPVDIPALRLARIDRFLALVPARPVAALDALAAECVAALDRFRAPEGPDRVRRRRAGLTDRQAALLAEWGYPYVLDEFRFHLTLSGPSAAAERASVAAALDKVLGDILAAPLPVRDLALFGDPGGGKRFRLVKRYPLTAG